MTLSAADFDSPSLHVAAGSGPAFEMKFLIDDALAALVANWGRAHLQLDPHGSEDLGGGYRTTTIYTETPTLDVYQKSKKFRSRKYRVRRYGDAEWFYLERKTKRGDKVAKRRTRIDAPELLRLAEQASEAELAEAPEASNPDAWSGDWFRRCLARRQLAPVSQITYERLAFGGLCDEGPLRLTFDRNIHGTLIEQWQLVPFATGPRLLEGRVIMELKFRDALPSPFKLLIQEFHLAQTTVSKYRLCREANGIAAQLALQLPQSDASTSPS